MHLALSKAGGVCNKQEGERAAHSLSAAGWHNHTIRYSSSSSLSCALLTICCWTLAGTIS